MGLRSAKIRRPRRFNRHNAVQSRRRKKVLWLAAQRARIRNYRRFFAEQEEIVIEAEAGQVDQ
ncbi:hypothetical protein KUV95_14135 [Microbulbifer agarilyticus]|uniref:hypothetical protein n=1 Tax=Microbulbifer agarilyticus TaxID=260552 RepID=UPI001C963BC5|nr:hypothetical protein [Microbulbifer agarilyticus]MBY6191399.1 hypothetical protein [Microbulbifer agarilyticus]MBY6212693.1 hypothetical protein [Microbulbifer agarilyticus]MCA0901820.1 hypothetical protein [Microbulbifer agarilyticus]